MIRWTAKITNDPSQALVALLDASLLAAGEASRVTSVLRRDDEAAPALGHALQEVTLP